MGVEGLKDIFDTIKKVTDSVKKFNEKDTSFLQSQSTQSFIEYLNSKYKPEEIEKELGCSIEKYISETHHNLFQNKIKKGIEFFEDITGVVGETKVETNKLKEEIIPNITNNENISLLQKSLQMVSGEESPIKNMISNFLLLSTEVEKNQFLQSLGVSIASQNITQKSVSKEENIKESQEIVSNTKEDNNKDIVDYNTIVESVIEHIEGGYYHPNMNIAHMGKSGETMMGIDRKNGGDLNTSDIGKKFRATIDQSKKEHPELRKHNYKGGNKEKQLVSFAGQIIKPHYENLCSKYLSNESLKLINNDKRLLFNFVYCAWNGEGRFKKFSNKINEEVKKGTHNTESLYKEIMNYRKNGTGNKLIAKGGQKIEKILEQGLV